MKVTLIQAPLVWENPEANRDYFTKKISGYKAATDLFVLPEMFTSGFTMSPDRVAESMEGKTLHWMWQIAVKKQAAVCGSVVIEEEGKYYNRFLFVFPDGHYDYYNKRHLFTLAGEERIYTAGYERKIITYKGWRICPLVCYDLRFPVFARNTKEYDLLLFVANWPEKRIAAWDILLKARAIENMCYTIGVNRVGHDGNGHLYTGHSQVIGPLGEPLAVPFETEGMETIILDKEYLKDIRQKFPFLEDRDDFVLNV